MTGRDDRPALTGDRPAMTGGLLICGGAILAALGTASRMDARGHAGPFIALLAAASLAYLAALAILARGRPGRQGLAIALALGVAWRLALLAGAPLVSDDVYRYVWDGRVQQHGLDPYRAVPADPALAFVHTDATRRIDPTSAVLPSIYPPLAQRFFLGVTALGGSAAAMAAAVLACDLAIIGLLWRRLAAAGRDPAWVLAYAWHPLVALEGAGGAHIDVVGTLLLVAAVGALSARRPLGAALALAGAIAVKLLPVVLLPLLWRRIRIRHAAAAAALVAGVSLPFAVDGGLPVGSLGAYVAGWRFNGPLFRWLAPWVGAWTVAGLAVAAGLAAAVWTRRTRSCGDPAAWAWPLAAALVLMPAVYPWYLVWLTPFLGPRATWPLAVWSVASLATYAVWTPYLAGAGWVLPAWVEPVEYGLALAAGVWTLAAARRRRAEP